MQNYMVQIQHPITTYTLTAIALKIVLKLFAIKILLILEFIIIFNFVLNYIFQLIVLNSLLHNESCK